MTPEHGIQERTRYDCELDEMINVNIDAHVKPCLKGKRKMESGSVLNLLEGKKYFNVCGVVVSLFVVYYLSY